MLPVILSEAYAIYREIALGAKIGNAINSIIKPNDVGPASKQHHLQNPVSGDEFFPIISAVLLNDVTKALKLPLADDDVIITSAVKAVNNGHWLSTASDPQSRSAMFMRLFASELAGTGTVDPDNLNGLVSVIKDKSQLMDLFSRMKGNRGAALLRQLEENSPLTHNLAFLETFPDSEDAQQVLKDYLAALASGNLPQYEASNDLINNALVGNVFMPEHWLIMISSAVQSELRKFGRHGYATVGNLTLSNNGMFTSSGTFNPSNVTRPKHQTRTLLRVDINNTEAKLAKKYGTQIIQIPKQESDDEKAY